MSRRWLIAVSGLAHLALAGGLFVSGIWRIERLDAERRVLTLTAPLPMPAPSGGPVAAEKVVIKRKTPTVIAKGTVQPEHKKLPEVTAPDPGSGDVPGPGKGSGDPTATGTCTENCGESKVSDPVCGDGSVDASEQCDDGNTVSGDGCSSSCRTEVKPKPTTAMVAPNVLQGLRVSGETQIHPSDATRNMMIRDDATRVVGALLVCIATDGTVASATMRASTKYGGYDATLLSAVRSWRYRPYTLNGMPVPACSTVTFIYTIK